MRGVAHSLAALLAGLSGLSISPVHAIYENAFGQYPDPCPKSCSEVGPDPANWTRIPRVEGLGYCDVPLLFEINVQNDLNGEGAQVPLRACTQAGSVTNTGLEPGPLEARQNGSLPSIANNCGAEVNKTTLSAQATSNLSAQRLSAQHLDAAVGQLVSYLERVASCGATILFAKAGNVVAGLYSGAEIQHESAITFLETFRGRVAAGDGMLQLCETGTSASRTMGVVVDTLEHLANVQGAVKAWTNSECVKAGTGESSAPVKVEVGMLVSTVSDSTSTNSSDAAASTQAPSRHKRGLCRDIQVVSGDSCASLASRCGISGYDFERFNQKTNLCSTLMPKQYVCCSAGDLPDHTPQPNADGSCHTYTIAFGDGCWSIGEAFGITQTRIEEVNKNTWGWAGCAALQPKQVICLSSGSPPFPAAEPGTMCGPQVPGTTKPADDTPWTQLNQCPLKACCSNWGFCGTTAEFCTPPPAGSANGCISNCGSGIVNNDSPPSTFRRVGYFEGWNGDRPCLHMNARQINTSAVTHVHFAFVTVNADFSISVGDKMKTQWKQFRELGSNNTGNVRKIASFGGWAFSTEPATLGRFRDATKAENRLKFAQNCVAFLQAEGLDGLDFDWEYPGAPDIPGVPPGTKEHADNYLEFLKMVRRRLPTGKELSIAIPASFWYLKSYPLEEIAKVVDYLVTMTYDFHGQWDVDNQWATPGCPAGNCLRSHVNKTLTEGALSMVTKAGVPANKVLVGVSSYGRSFRMTDYRCAGAMCTYTGTNVSSDAYKGRCTGTKGYISNAEIDEIIKDNPRGYPVKRVLFDSASESNILVYGSQTQADYVGFMSADVKKRRTEWVQGLNFGGTTDWALDLMQFVPEDDDDSDDIPDDEKCSPGDMTYSSTRPSREGEYMLWLLMEPEYAATTGRTYITIVNLTPHPFVLEYSHQNQMDAWDWDSIPPGKSRQNVAEHTGRVGANPKDTNGEAYYRIGDTGKKFQVRSTTHIPDTYPLRVVFDLSGMGKGQREYKVPEQEVPVTLVITGSNDYGFITSLSFGPANWMNGLKEVIKDRPLRHVVMPGSHDSGMSKLTGAIATGATSSNTQTQGLSTYDQLRVGARWLDLRVQTVHQVAPKCCDNYEFWTTHVSDEKGSAPIGQSGESLDEVVDNINKFTSESPGEVIILQFRYLIGIRNVPSLGPIYWQTKQKDEFFDKLRKINNRCGNIPIENGPDSTKKLLADRTVGSLMSSNDGKGCVLIFLDTAHLGRTDIAEADQVSRPDGIYRNGDLPWTDGWPKAEDTKDVAEFNVNKWAQPRGSDMLVAQWLSTPNALTSTFTYSLQAIAVLPTNPALYWRGVPDMSPTAFPNVLMVDYLGQILMNDASWGELGAELYTLAVGLNLYMLSENCNISARRSPLLPPKRSIASARVAAAAFTGSSSSSSSSQANNNNNPLVSSWNGIIFANGTTIDNPPPTLHVGRPEMLRKGTVFSNGTVLAEDMRNPEYEGPFHADGPGEH